MGQSKRQNGMVLQPAPNPSTYVLSWQYGLSRLFQYPHHPTFEKAVTLQTGSLPGLVTHRKTRLLFNSSAFNEPPPPSLQCHEADPCPSRPHPQKTLEPTTPSGAY